MSVLSPHSGSRRGVRRLAVVSVALAGLGAAVAVPAAAGATSRPLLPRSAHSAGIAQPGVHYAKVVPLCGSAKPGEFSCDALRRVPLSVRPGDRLPAGAQPYAPAAGPAGGYSPSDLEALYEFSRTSHAGNTIGIVDWYADSSVRADLDVFDENYGFPDEAGSSFKVVNQDGTSDLSGVPPSGTSGGSDTSPEISLDVQAVRAACATCRIILVEANGPTDADLATAENTAVRLGSKEVSNSFGRPEQGSPDSSFNHAFNHPGTVITASTGDDGWYDWDFQASVNAPNEPSSLPSVVAVGGTAVVNQSGRYEQVWNGLSPGDGGNYDGASGGGCSTLYPAVRWQRKVSGYNQTGCGNARLAGDVAAVADPLTGFDVYDSYDGLGWFTVGGTSLASPFVAALWALAGGAHGVAYPALTLYGNQKSHRSRMHDITIGGNGLCGYEPSRAQCESDFGLSQSPNTIGFGELDCAWDAAGNPVSKDTQCYTATGYDGPSGVGTPNGLGMFRPLHLHLKIKGPHRVARHHKVHYTAKAADPFPGGTITKYRWTLAGQHAHSKRIAAIFGKKGKARLKLKVTDIYGQTKKTHITVHVHK